MDYFLRHIFDKSACLSCRQMADYVSESMTNEEVHAAEHHMAGCPLCATAVEGLQAFPKDATLVLPKLNSKFLATHLDAGKVMQEAPAPPPQVKTDNSRNVFKVVLLVGAAILVIVALVNLARSYQHTPVNTSSPPMQAPPPVVSPPRDTIKVSTGAHPPIHKKLAPGAKKKHVTHKQQKIILHYDDDFSDDTAYHPRARSHSSRE